MKTTILALTLAIVMTIDIFAQEREAPQLDLGDLGWAGVAFDSVTAFNERPYLWGWNWLSMDSSSSRVMGMNVWHLNDPYAWWPWQGIGPDTINWSFGASWKFRAA